jgi:hypothetical protein
MVVFKLYFGQTFFMKRLSLALLFFALLFSGSLKAQEREMISETRKESTRSDVTESYWVLKSDKTVKDGPYRMLRNNKLLVSGYYRNGQKDSVWEIGNPGSGVIIARPAPPLHWMRKPSVSLNCTLLNSFLPKKTGRRSRRNIGCR